VQNKVGGNPGNASAAWNRIKWTPQFPMLSDVGLDLIEFLARESKCLLELRLGLNLGFA
jgi:hypothetical protein